MQVYREYIEREHAFEQALKALREERELEEKKPKKQGSVQYSNNILPP